MFKKNLAGLLCVALIICGCGAEQPDSKAEAVALSQADSVAEKKPAPPKEVPRPVVRFKAYNLRSDSIRKAFEQRFSEAEKHVIFSLNRVDAKHAYRMDTLVVPDTFLADRNLYSPFPLHLDILDSVRKMVMFSYASQAFAAYAHGKLQRWGPSSMGTKRNPTPTGLHYCNWKSKKSVSTVKSEWILPWNFNIMNQEGVGWHQYDLPGYPASHSCLRLLEEDAKWLYTFGEQWILKDSRTLAARGTPVLVFGAYPFEGRKPWLHLPEDPQAVQVDKNVLEDLLKPLLPEILEAQRTRESLTSPGRDGRVDEPSTNTPNS